MSKEVLNPPSDAPEELSVEGCRWNPCELFGYSGHDDSQIQTDVARYIELQRQLKACEGGIATASGLEEALRLQALSERAIKPLYFLQLLQMAQPGDDAVNEAFTAVHDEMAAPDVAKCGAWLAPAIQAMGEDALRQLASESEVVGDLLGELLGVHARGKHTLTPESEALLGVLGGEILLKKSRGALNADFQEVRVSLAGGDLADANLGDELVTQRDALLLAADTEDPTLRRAIYERINQSVAQVAGQAARVIERSMDTDLQICKFRKYKLGHLERAAFGSGIAVKSLKYLLDAGKTVGRDLFSRYRAVWEEVAGREMTWHDRQRMPDGLQSTEVIPWKDQGMQAVVDAFDFWAPEAARYVEKSIERGCLNIDSYPGKTPGHWNIAMWVGESPDDRREFCSTDYRGRRGNLFLVGHEFGHGWQKERSNSRAYHEPYHRVPDIHAEVPSIGGARAVALHQLSQDMPDDDRLLLAFEYTASVIHDLLFGIGAGRVELLCRDTVAKTTRLPAKIASKHFLDGMADVYGDVVDPRLISNGFTAAGYLCDPAAGIRYTVSTLHNTTIWGRRDAMGPREFGDAWSRVFLLGSQFSVSALEAEFGVSLGLATLGACEEAIDATLRPLIEELERLVRLRKN